MSKVIDDETGDIHFHVYLPANKEGSEPQIGGGRLSSEEDYEENIPAVSGHPQEHLVRDGSENWWLVVSNGNNEQEGSLTFKSLGKGKKRKNVARELTLWEG